MRVGLAYTDPDDPIWLQIDIPEGSTLKEAIEASGLLKRYPQIDLDKQKVGIFGKLAKLDTVIKEGDRVEIYRPITADPKKVKRRKRDAEEQD